MNFERWLFGIGILNLENKDRVVVFGGMGQNYVSMNTVEVYIAENDTWQVIDIELQVENYQFGFLTIKNDTGPLK